MCVGILLMVWSFVLFFSFLLFRSPSYVLGYFHFSSSFYFIKNSTFLFILSFLFTNMIYDKTYRALPSSTFLINYLVSPNNLPIEQYPHIECDLLIPFPIYLCVCSLYIDLKALFFQLSIMSGTQHLVQKLNFKKSNNHGCVLGENNRQVLY